MKRFASLLIVAAAVAAAPIHTAEAARRAFIVDQTGVPITKSDGSSPTLEETRAAIIAGAAKHHWVVKEEAPGNIKLQLNNGGATVLVDIPYRAGSFDIRYLSSEGMKYSSDANGRRSINASYRRWIDNLAGAIVGGRRPQAAQPEPNPSLTPAGAVRLEDLPLPPPVRDTQPPKQ